MLYLKKIKLKITKNLPGSAILLSVFLLTSIILVAYSGAIGVLANVKMSGAVKRSALAYFAAESGAERLLYEVRKNGYDLGAYSYVGLFPGTLENSGTYSVDYKTFAPIVFTSVGSYEKMKRSVEISF